MSLINVEPLFPVPSSDDPTTLRGYQRDIDRFRKYPQPGDGTEKVYCIAGIGNEAGEYLGKLKKLMRGDKGDSDVLLSGSDVRLALAAELGDVLWYAAALATEYRIDFYSEIVANLPIPSDSDFHCHAVGSWAANQKTTKVRWLVTEAMGLLSAAGKLADFGEGSAACPVEVTAAFGNPQHVEAHSLMTLKWLRVVVAYLDVTARYLGFTLGQVARMNVEKLTGRLERGTLKGDGDNR